MKKLFSCLLAVVMVLSVIFPITGAISSLLAQATDATVADIDFSESFYSENTYVHNFLEDHGKALKFDRVSITTENWGRAIIWPLGEDNAELELTVGSTVDIELDIFKEKLHPATAGDTDYRDFSMGIVYLTDTEANNSREAISGGLMNYASRIMKVADVEGTLSAKWEKVSGQITVPEHAADAKPYILVYGDYQTSFDKTAIWVDNIKLSSTTPAYNVSIDFTEEFYASNHRVEQFSNPHGKALEFVRISIATENWGNAVLHELGDNNGALKLAAGQKFDVSLDIYKELLPPATAGSTNYRNFSVGIIYLNDTEVNNVRNQVANNCLNKYASRIMQIADVEGALSEGWETVSGTVTVPEYTTDAKAYIVLFGNYQTRFTETKVWVDNIAVTEASETEDPDYSGSQTANIDFSESFYSSNNSVVQYNATYGKALYFNRISIATENWGNAVLHELGDDDGALKLTAGKTFDVTLDLQKELLPPATTGGTDYRDFSVGIIYLNDTEVNNVRNQVANNCLNKYASRIMKVADVKGATAADWEKVTGTITVPEYAADAKAYLLLYGNYQTRFTETKVWIDNIVLTENTEVSSSVADIDFSEGFYSANNYVVQYNCTYGKALYFNRISIVTESWGNAVLHALGDDGGELKLTAGDTLDVTFDLRKELLPPATAGGTDYRDFSVGIIYLNDTEVTNARDAKNGGLMTYASRIMKLADVKGGTAADWENLSGTITVPLYANDAKAYIVIYGGYQTRFTETKVWIDNIVFNQSEQSDGPKKTLVADIDYSESYYDTSRKVMQYNGEHGRAQSFDRVSHISADWGRAVIWPVGDDNGKLDLMAGDVLTVSLEVIKNKLHPITEGGTDYRDFSIGMLYLTEAEAYAVEQGENGGLMFYADRIMKLADVEGTLSTDWETVGGEITVLPHAPDTVPYMVLYGDYQTSFTLTEIWIDNIKFIREKEMGATYEVSFETNGAGSVESVKYIEGFPPNVPMLSRNGYYFEGWFTDPECTVPYTAPPTPARDFKLYAAWTSLDNIKIQSLKTGFEPSDYESGTVPYTNQAPDEKTVINGVTDQTNTSTARILTNDGIAKEGTHSLYFDNFDYENFCSLYNRNSQGANAVAILNSDASNFMIVGGVRYRVSFDQFVNGVQMWDSKDATINLVVAKNMPTDGLLTTGAVSVYEFKFGEHCTDDNVATGTWNHYEAYFEAEVTGNLYMLLYASSGSTGKGYYCRIDNLEIVPSTEEAITRMTFHKAVDDETVLDKFAGIYYGEIYGKPGTVFSEPSAPKVTGKRFVKWVDVNNVEFTDYRIPDEDIDLYPVYESAATLPMTTTMNWDDVVTVDFEDTAAIKQFYGDQRNMQEQKRYGVKPVYDDPENAHSGNNYFSFYKAKNYNGTGVPFRLYNADSPGNYIWLDANSQYRITYYVNFKWQSDPSSELRTVGFKSYDGTDLETFDKIEFKRADETDTRGWRKVEQIITVGTESRILGFQFWGGILTMDLDDITVEKLGIVTVTFESNGGSAVEPVETGAYYNILEPEYPTKQGYEFAGWYTDKELTQKFDFNATVITDNIKLYAKWIVPTADDGEDNSKKYETVYETLYEERVVENEIDDPKPNDGIIISGSDTPAKQQVVINETDTQFPWLIILIIAVALFLIADTVIAVIIIAKKRKNKE